MRHVPISAAKDRLSALAAAAAAGEEIVLTRHGKATVKIVAIDKHEEERGKRFRTALERVVANRARLRAEGRKITVEEWIGWKNEGRP